MKFYMESAGPIYNVEFHKNGTEQNGEVFCYCQLATSNIHNIVDRVSVFVDKITWQ